MTRPMVLIALLAAFMLVLAACAETTPERVDDVTDDVPADTTDDATDDADEVIEEEATEPESEDTVEASDDAVTEPDEAADDAAADDAVEESDDGVAEETESDDEADATPEPEADDSELEEAEGFGVGDTVRMGELVMRLHSVRWDDGDEFFGPDEGMRWLIADIEIENEADSSTHISSLLMFDLIDQDNRARDLAFMADTEGSLDGELGAGRSLRGDIAWEVRAEQTEWELIFSPELFGFGQAIFDITEADF